jgi:glycosyltransferase involved in cell wall biosynthesis
MKVFLHGRDNIGWSIDQDRRATEVFLKALGHKVTANFLTADVVHSVWWNLLLGYRAYPLRWKKMIAVATNEIDVNDPQFARARAFVNLWIAPSRMMHDRLKLAGVDVKYQPFYTDENTFLDLKKTREELARELGIDNDAIKDRLIVSSFQRDSLGGELNKPKWQKGPDRLLSILAALPRDKLLLLLAGPRRHWTISRCRESGIPYLYYGKEPANLEEDISYNTVDRPTLNKLYNLCDINIVSSRSEGGPKAVLEAAFSRTMIFSTDVGLARDFLDPWCIYATTEEVVPKIAAIMDGKDISTIVNSNYQSASRAASYQPTLDRWKEIYDYFQDKYTV